MCGRFALTVSARVLADLFDLPELAVHRLRYNIAPTQAIVIVSTGPDGGRRWRQARWGLIPSWASDGKIGARMINARAETVMDKPAFRSAMLHRRCLVPADGFYEWRKEAGVNQPYFIRFVDGRLFAFAALWERWRPADAAPVDSCTVVTTTPNKRVAEIHDRMPVIVPPDLFDEWLAPEPLDAEGQSRILAPHAADGMEAFPVDPRVNSPAHDDPACTRPASQQRLW